MTWQLSSPDLPFLNQITISQVRHGFWENILPYAPFATAIISACVSTVGILITCNLAGKARKIASQQKAIAEEAKKIAQDKLDVDVFDKRFAVYNAYQEYYNNLVMKNYTDKKDCTDDFLLFQSMYERSIFLFSQKDHFIFESLNEVLQKMHLYRNANIKRDVTKDMRWQILVKEFCNKNGELVACFKEYLPDVIHKRTTSSKIVPASPDTPPPTAPTADQ